MDVSATNQIKEKLQTERQKIAEQLENMTQQKTFNKDKVQAKWEERGDKEEDNAIEVAEYQDSISLERNLEVNLEKINAALAKIDKGSYGKCDRCGGDIEEDRLIAYPEAVLCLSCTSKPK